MFSGKFTPEIQILLGDQIDQISPLHSHLRFCTYLILVKYKPQYVRKFAPRLLVIIIFVHNLYLLEKKKDNIVGLSKLRCLL